MIAQKWVIRTGLPRDVWNLEQHPHPERDRPTNAIDRETLTSNSGDPLLCRFRKYQLQTQHGTTRNRPGSTYLL